jgi:MoaA/NifB/PqqE/SkfB family radical SAM enzyme
MLDQLQGFHIEPTNMCTLKCPRCSRTEFIEQFPKKWTNKNLNLEHLKSFLDIELKGKEINLCGNYGDAIYYDRLFALVDYFKSNGATILLRTNGSYRSPGWWADLNQLLDQNDEIIFGIDGTSETFTQYRINADWESIKDAIGVLNNGKVKLTWQHILFSHNENNVDQAKQQSIEMGFDKFLLIDSKRWDREVNDLAPKTITNTFGESKILWKQKTTNINITPECLKHHNLHYISADGIYTPCCYSAEHRFYYKSEFYKNRHLYDISKTTITEVLDHLKDFYSTLEDAKLNYCTFNCPKL